MKLKLTLGFSLSLFMSGLNAQVTSLNLEYNSVPGIGCHSNMSACLSSGAQAESGAQIIVDWTDGSADTMMAYMAPNAQSCYAFEHNYSQPGVYNALVTVTSGTLGGQVAGSQTIEWVITSTTNCGFFNVISLLNPSATFMSNVPYDVTNNAGVTTTIYPKNSFGNPYYTELDVANVPYNVSINQAWLSNNGFVQTSPDFTINSFDVTGRAESTPVNMTLICLGTGVAPNLEVANAAAFQFVAPLQKGNVVVQVCNDSCGFTANTTIKISIPQGVIPDLTNVPNATFANDTVTVLHNNLNECTTIYFPCTFAGTTPAGTVFNFFVEASAVDEQDFLFNSLPFTATVLNSYDPNDKQCNLPAIINPDVQENLIYTVRFQNDGNFPALNVVVRDTISSNLDLSTFRFINSKHPVSYCVNPTTREVVFRFSGINLLPSGDDLDGSQGFLTYSVDELPNLPLNSEIKNTAYIFFDFNPAIITNTTVNTNAYVVGIETLESDEMGIAPNPSNGDFTISSSEVGTFNILNELGQLVRTVEITEANGNQVKVENMPNGAYFVTGMLKGEAVTKKVIVVR